MVRADRRRMLALGQLPAQRIMEPVAKTSPTQTPPRQILFRWLTAGLVVSSTLAILVAGELAARWRGGYEIARARLTVRPGLRPGVGSTAGPRLPAPVGPELTEEDRRTIRDVQAAMARKTNPNFFDLDPFKRWNSAFVREHTTYFQNWPIRLETFDGGDDPHPPWKYRPGRPIFIRGFKIPINSFGWKGKEVQIPKPAGTFRIVCLGASTTEDQNVRSYPETLEIVLNKPLSGKRRIEVLNAGFHGQGARDLLAWLRQTVVQAEPDMVIYYEGANDLYWPSAVPGWQAFQSSAPRPVRIPWGWLGRYSSLWRIMRTAGRGDPTLVPEAPRPAHEFRLDPAPSDILGVRQTLREMIRVSRAHEIRFVLSSFVVLAHEGLELSALSHAAIWNALN